MELDDIHPQLLADCHYLGSLPACALLLHRNPALPWFILVPDTHLADVLDLPEEERRKVLADCAAVSVFIKRELGFGKVNFAGLGNVVPQMHLHVIGRHDEDACWPQPVWGRLPDAGVYPPEQVQAWQAMLAGLASLVPAAS